MSLQVALNNLLDKNESHQEVTPSPIAPAKQDQAQTELNADKQSIETEQTDTPFDPNALPPTSAGEAEFQNESVANNASAQPPLIGLLDELPPLPTIGGERADISYQTSAPIAKLDRLMDEDDSLLPTSPEPEMATIPLNGIHVQEDSIIIRSGDLNGDFDPISTNTSYGQFSTDSQGQWQYELNNQLEQIQALGAGDSLQETIRFSNSDGETFSLKITIHGSNDIASIQGIDEGQVQEDAAFLSGLSANGELSVTDQDLGEARFIPFQNKDTQYGSVEVGAQGDWTYKLDDQSPAVQALGEGAQAFDSFIVQTLDGSQTVVRIEIIGQNDIPIFSGSNDAYVDIDSQTSASGKLDISDADLGESHFIEEQDILTNFGRGSISENGDWSYTLEKPIEGLTPGNSLYDFFVVTTADGTEQNINVIITNNSAPDILPVSTNTLQSPLALGDVLETDTLASTASPDPTMLTSSVDPYLPSEPSSANIGNLSYSSAELAQLVTPTNPIELNGLP